MSNTHKLNIGSHALHINTMMLEHGYNPELSQGAVKPPIFFSSTYVFPAAEAGENFFNIASGRIEGAEDNSGGLVYARINHPNAQIVEERLALLEGAEMAAVFSSGMAAISNVFLAYCKPGDVILCSSPLYGGTTTLLQKVLPEFNITSITIPDACEEAGYKSAIAQTSGRRVTLIYLETPSNPTLTLSDISLAKKMAHDIEKNTGHRPLVVVDNTLQGPIFQKAIQCGADISLYSLTKYIGGHSDLVAGGAMGSKEVMKPIRLLRSMLGGSLDPNSCWMLTRSMETLDMRMRRAAENAAQIASFLNTHKSVKKVFFPTQLKTDSRQYDLYLKQCTGPGALMSFDVGSREKAFFVLNHLQVIAHAVSLGGTESLICHPATTVHSGLSAEVRAAIGITDGLLRLSVGIGDVSDIQTDLDQALNQLL